MINKILICIYTLFILLYPCQIEIYGLTYAKILMVISSAFLIYQLIKLKKQKKLFETANKLKNSLLFYFIIGILLFTVCVSISNAISIFSGSKLYLANIFEILRGLLYIVTTINYFIFFQENDNNNKFFKKILIFSIIFTLFICFIQYFNLFNVNNLYIRYIAPTQYKTLINNYPNPRIVGLTGNPNVLGCLLNIYLIYILYNIIKNKKININYLLFLLIRIAIYMTGTRSAFILSVISELVLFIFMLTKKSRLKETLFKFLVVITCEILMVFCLPNSMTWRIKQLVDLSSIKSWNVRVEHTKDILDNIFTKKEKNEENDNSNNEKEYKQNNEKQDGSSNELNYILDNDKSDSTNNEQNDSDTESSENNNNDKQELNNDSSNLNVNTEKLAVHPNKFIKLFFGIGSDKENHDAKKGENEWLMIFYKYGIIGIISFLMIFVLQLYKIKHNTRIKNSLFFAMFILVAVYMIPQGFYHVYNLMLAFIILYCYETECD